MKNAVMNVLLVEDNEGDVELAKIAFREGKIAAEISVARDGFEAVNYLSKKGEFSDAGTPDIIMLDINMPKMDGREVLDFIKQHEKLKSIPVVMFTSSSAPQDVAACYERHANCYIIKPTDFADFTRAIQQVEDFWLRLARLPYKPAA